MELTKAQPGREYTVQAICTQDRELDRFLFTLGCYVGQKVTVIFHGRKNLVFCVKDARYSIDSQLAAAILV